MEPPQQACAEGEIEVVVGEKGTLALTDRSVGNAGVAMFNKMVRKLPLEEQRSLLRDMLLECQAQTDLEQAEFLLENIFVLLFQSRDIDKGKGERAIFYNLFLDLYTLFPEIILALIPCIPRFGSWIDVIRILNNIEPFVEQTAAVADWGRLRSALLDFYADELRDASSKVPVTPTLSGKWAPREGLLFDSTAKALARILFPDIASDTFRMKKYRQMIVKLTRVVEQQMSSRHFSDINFSAVPSVAMTKYKSAFLAEKEDDDDRKRCRERFLEYMSGLAYGKTKVNAKALYPHQVVSQVIRGFQPETAPLLNAQWEVIVNKFLKDTCEECGCDETTVVDTLRGCVSLCDVSGSMSGTPMEVCVAMGLILAQYSTVFPNTVITFEETPHFATVTGDTFVERAQALLNIPWGGSTNFVSAVELLLDKACETHMAPENFPKILFVFSDMQFDQAQSTWTYDHVTGTSTMIQGKWGEGHQMLKERFETAGYPLPLVVYWNLRGDAVGHVATADAPGVVMLSGFNIGMLRKIFSGEDLTTIDLSEFAKTIDSAQVYANVVEDVRYQDIRDVVLSFNVFKRGVSDIPIPPLLDTKGGCP